MYYGKSNSATLTVPPNYSGNTFRHTDEDAHVLTDEATNESHPTSPEEVIKQDKKDATSPLLSLLSGISIEDVLLLGLILVIHQENPNDSMLIFLLILLLAK